MDDDAKLRNYAAALADAVEAALPKWVDRAVQRVLASQQIALTAEVVQAVAAAGAAARAEIGAAVRALVNADVDEQRGNPLAILRSAVRFPADVLRQAGARPVERDAFAAEAFPDDEFNLAPATWSDLDESLHEFGIVWGAAKAHVVLRRRRTEGKR